MSILKGNKNKRRVTAIRAKRIFIARQIQSILTGIFPDKDTLYEYEHQNPQTKAPTINEPQMVLTYSQFNLIVVIPNKGKDFKVVVGDKNIRLKINDKDMLKKIAKFIRHNLS